MCVYVFLKVLEGYTLNLWTVQLHSIVAFEGKLGKCDLRTLPILFGLKKEFGKIISAINSR